MTRILIVDDSLTMRLYISTIAKQVRIDSDIILCASAEEAIPYIDEAFDYYSLDYTLPGMSGIELANKILHRHAIAKIVMVTGNKQEAVRSRCDAIKITMIVKPDIEEPLIAFFSEEKLT